MMRNVIIALRTKEGFKAEICTRKVSRTYTEIFINIKKSSLINCIKEEYLVKLTEFYNRYSKSLRFNSKKFKPVGIINAYALWITARKNDLGMIVKKIIKIFKGWDGKELQTKGDQISSNAAKGVRKRNFSQTIVVGKNYNKKLD